MAVECSVIVPLCNAQQSLPTMHLRLSSTLCRMAIPYEVIYIDDGSTDDTASIIRDLYEQDSSVKAIFLSRNFGHQAALCAGLEAASGRAVITIDGDLQDPPELIPKMIDKWHEGYQVVYARRRRRPDHPLKRTACFLFYRTLCQLSDLAIPLDTGDYALMDRQAVNQLNAMPERTRFIRGLRSWVGFKQTHVEYDRDRCYEGKSKYSVQQLARLGLDGVFAFSQVPLKGIAVLGVLVMLLATGSLVLTASGLGQRVTEHTGLLWLGSCLALLGGVQLTSMGVIGAYLGRIHDEVRARPLYVTQERLGFQRLPRPVPNVLEFLPSETVEHQDSLTAARLKPSPSGSSVLS